MKLLINCALILAATTCVCRAQTGSGNQNTSISPEQFIHQAALSGIKEVETSKIAKQKASSSKVKDFASMMTQDHGKANTELMALAKSKNIQLPKQTNAANANKKDGDGSQKHTDRDISGAARNANGNSDQKNATGSDMKQNTTVDSLKMITETDVSTAIQQLNSLTGTNFDNAYIQMMVMDHQNAIMLFEQGSKSTDPDIKTFANKHLPTLRSHLQQISGISVENQGTKDTKY